MIKLSIECDNCLATRPEIETRENVAITNMLSEWSFKLVIVGETEKLLCPECQRKWENTKLNHQTNINQELEKSFSKLFQ